MQVVEDVALVFERRASFVRVFQAQDERATHALGKQVVEQRRSRRADVQRAGGAGRDAHADRLAQWGTTHGSWLRLRATSTAVTM